MATSIKSSIGTIHLLKKNARIIRDSAFNALVQSIEDDPEFLMARGVVVWMVPKLLTVDDPSKNPFTGQEGELVVIGGNQRCKAFMALGMTEVKDEWIVEAKNADGTWWSPDKAERFVLKDNNPEGIAGENDYKKMFENFSLDNLKLSGIDFASLDEFMTAEEKGTPEEEVELGEHGEKSEQLKEFIEHREQTRKDLKEIDETGFYLLLVFETFEQKAEFISKAGLTGENGVVATNGDVYVALVFESYAQKIEFCDKAGIEHGEHETPPEEGSVRLVYDIYCDGRAFAAKFGIPLKETGLHFRDRKIDSQLAEMAREEAPQKSVGEIEEEIHAEAKANYKEGDEYV